jgi:glycerol dehydrogenase-like iron-containing ADH family enzyme
MRAPEVTIGRPFKVVEASLYEVLRDLGPFIAVVNEPPWSDVARHVPTPARMVRAGDMALERLETLAGFPDAGETVVGIGGGSAMDTAKFLAWKSDAPLIQVPTITSVDAAFTDAIGVRVARRVRYIGKVEPQMVLLDVPLIRSAPARLNQAGVGDVLSCHTGLYDWRLASRAGQGHPWRDDLAELGRDLLVELDAASEDIAAVTEDGVRFLADAYRRIGAACAAAGHSRFEEGSEHFWAYAYEAATGAHHIHGELIACGVVAVSTIQANDADWAAGIIARSGIRAHPDDLGIDEHAFKSALLGLAAYARTEGLDYSIADANPITEAHAEAAWRGVCALPRKADPS